MPRKKAKGKAKKPVKAWEYVKAKEGKGGGSSSSRGSSISNTLVAYFSFNLF
jgi:hypothetical protein